MDNLLIEIIKFARLKDELMIYNNEESAKPYNREIPFGTLSKRYVWDGASSLDDLLKGLAVQELVDLFNKYRNKSYPLYHLCAKYQELF